MVEVLVIGKMQTGTLKDTSMHILPLYAALLGFLFFYLSVRTIGLRRRLKIGIGSNENDEMLRGMRVHSNFAEYVPISLILIFLVEVQGGHQWLIHALGVLLLVGRSLHAYGVSQMNENFVFRVTGMSLTFTTMLTSSCVLLFNFVAK
jgi:uncharacterized protein